MTIDIDVLIKRIRGAFGSFSYRGKNSANLDGSEAAPMDALDNLARIPAVKHWKLNSWHQTPNFECGGMTPRDYLPGKSWDERRRVGLIGLRYIGVLQ